MISEIKKAMVDLAPKKAAKLQREKRFDRYAKAVAKRHLDAIQGEMPGDDDPNGQRIHREIALAAAIEEATSPEDLSEQTM